SHDIEVAVPVQIAGQGAMDARHQGQEVMRVRKPPAVFEPANAVVRPQIKAVGHVAIGIQDVEIAVAVEIDELDSARPERRLVGLENPLAPEISRALIQERLDAFVFLTDEGEKIEPAVAIEVDGRDVNGPMSRIDLARTEFEPPGASG